MKTILPCLAFLISSLGFLGAAANEPSSASSTSKPNIILIFADDISARELPIYNSSTWSKPDRGDTSDPAHRAKTPVLDQLANEGCWVTTAWASVVCSPSRAMMMTGRFAHRHKWWNNKDTGYYLDENGKPAKWPLYKSSPEKLIGHVAQKGGYQTYWAGKTQMPGDLSAYGFHEGCFTPGNLSDTDNPYTDFKHFYKKIDGERTLFDADTGKQVDTYQQHGWYFYPHVRLMNHCGEKGFQWWPNTEESKKNFGPQTYGPDVELDFIFDYMDRQKAAEQPFFIYHTTHLGHDAYDWLNPDSTSSWPGTPVIKWDGEKYTRTEPKVTGDKGNYDTHGTITESGIHHHVNYLDYQVWLYQNKLEEMGIADNTILIFCADNGTSGYGKGSGDRSKGTHVPLIIHAPGMTKKGKQDILVSMADIVPTIAEIANVDLPEDFEINGKSLVPFLFTEQKEHRDHVYGYRYGETIVQGKLVMKDGRDKWWDVSETPADLISFPQITDWTTVSEAHRAERDKLLETIKPYDIHKTAQHSPGFDPALAPPSRAKGKPKKPQSKKQSQPVRRSLGEGGKPDFKDTFDSDASLKNFFKIGPTPEAWTIVDGVLVGKQIKANHGCVIRRNHDFDDIKMEIDFRFNGGSRFNFVFDDSAEKSVWASHICRVSISPKFLQISDDKTGSMNLEIRNRRKAETLTAEDEKILKDSVSNVKLALKQGQWYQLRVVIKDDIMKVFIDEKLITNLKSPGINHPTKSKLGITVNGSTIEFDNFKVFKN